MDPCETCGHTPADDPDEHGCAAAAAAADPSWKRYDAAYVAAKKYYAEHPEALQPVTDLASEQKGAALELLEILIDPTGVAGGLA